MSSLNLGLDLGYGALKLYGRAGGVQLPSQIAAAQNHAVANLAGLDAEERPLLVEVNNQPYYVGMNAHSWGRPIENLDYDRLTGSPEIYALLYGALTHYLALEALPESAAITFYVGLPLEPLSGGEAEVKETLVAVRKWLTGVHVWKANGVRYRFQVERVEVTSQPAGAYFDYILDDAGRPHPQRAANLKNEVGVISIGFNTVERMVILGGKPVQKFTAGSTAGVRRLLERINEQDGGHYSLGELDTMLRNDELITRNAIDEWARQVGGELERTWGTSWKRFAHVVVVGGGALLLNGRLLPKFAGKAAIPDDPVLAISRGLYKLAQAQQKGN
jgi:hypothetical protein